MDAKKSSSVPTLQFFIRGLLSMNTISIGNRQIGLEFPPYFIADIAANHDGDLNRAFRLIELAKEAGADAAKFQNFSAKRLFL